MGVVMGKLKHTYTRLMAVAISVAAVLGICPAAYAEGVQKDEYTSTRGFIELNLYDYDAAINERWKADKKYPGFQWNGGAYEGSRGTGLYIVDAIDFGNSKITDYAYSGTGHAKSSTATAVGNGGGEINRLDIAQGVTNRPIGISTGVQVLASTLMNGYPALKDGSSLAWLFTEGEGVRKMNSESIDGLFLQDADTGTYSYNSRKTHAQYADNMFTRYREIITPNFIVYPFGNFLPFNDITDPGAATNVGGIDNISAYIDALRSRLGESATDRQLDYMLDKYKSALKKAGLSEASAADVTRDFISSGKNDSPGGRPDMPQSYFDSMYNIDWDEDTNFFFGMDMSMNFMMPEKGMTGANGDTPMVFSFSGDDDVWVYVDGVLFLDLSGIHRHVGGKIDFVNGMVHYYALDEKSGDVNMDAQGADGKGAYKSYSFAELLKAAGQDSSTLNSKGTFEDNSSHEFKFYYMERGSGSSVCSISFNFPLLPQTGELAGDECRGDAEDNDACLTTISIPGIELELPVWTHWSYEKLEQAPCRYSGSVGGGDLVLLAHNSEGQFGCIPQLRRGDEITITDAEGQKLRYRVAAHELLEAWEGGRLCSGEYELSLFTCSENGTKRHVLRCERE